MTNLIPAAVAQSIQDIPSVKETGPLAPFDIWMMSDIRGELLPRWGSFAREHELRRFYRNPYNTLLQGVFSGIAKRVASTPWEISGDENLLIAVPGPDGIYEAIPAVEYYQRVFRSAQFGRGWSDFIKRWVINYLRHDRGVYTELIAPGDPLEAPTGAITGLAVLDSIRCYNTGDPLYPVVYWSRLGDMHILPTSRIMHSVDMPDTDEAYPDNGMSALSRCVAVVQREILMGRYIAASLDDKPPPGIVPITGMTDEQFKKVIANYERAQKTDDGSIFGKTLFLHSIDPAVPLRIEPINFAQPPQKFDYLGYVNLDARQLAAAINLDIQEFWELSSGALGSGAQSKIIHAKSQGKAFGDIYTALERDLNDVLPEELEFKFKPKDSQADADEAANASSWASTSVSIGQDLTRDERRRLLAAKVQAVADVITDPSGTVVRYNDADIQSQSDVVSAEDDTPVDNNTSDQANIEVQQDRKVFKRTSTDFKVRFQDIVGRAIKGRTNREQAEMLLLGLLNSSGRKAYADGLKEGGVVGRLDEDDEAQVQDWIVKQIDYIDGLMNQIEAGTLTETQLSMRAELWVNKSLVQMQTAGRMAADKNGYYRWEIGKTEEHCLDCLRLNGQIHRLKEWYTRGWIPKSSKLACHGFNCGCKLVKVENEPARGRF